jgi:hypothetical protein
MLMGAAALSALCFVQPASALTMKQCSEKFKAAKDSGTTTGMSWQEFRKTECDHDATMAVKKVKDETKAGNSAEAGPNVQECSVRYQAAKKDGSLGKMKWSEFRKAGCVISAAAPAMPAERSTAAPADTAKETKTKVSSKECSTRYEAAKSSGTLHGMTWNEFRRAGCPENLATRSDSSMMPTAGGTFPATVSRKYASDSPGRARLLTCRDQYDANKAAGIAGPKWTERGGGYYHECNKRLKEQ